MFAAGILFAETVCYRLTSVVDSQFFATGK